jgi:two-component system sensor histidine kinase YesM
MNLRNKLVLSYLMASIIPIVIISLTIYKLSAASIEGASQQFASMYISQVVTTLDQFADKYDQVTRSVLDESEIMRLLSSDQPPAMTELIENKVITQSFFVRMITSNPDIRTVMLISSSGTLYSFAKDPVTVNMDILKQQSWYKQINESNLDPMFITPVHDRAYEHDKGGVAFTVGRVLWNYNGSYAGIMLLDLDPSQLIQLNKDFLQLGNQFDIRLFITNSANGMIYDSDAATGKLPWQSIVGQRYDTNNGKNSSHTSMVLSDRSDKGELYVSAEIPLDKLLARMNSMKRITVLSTLACLLFIITISVFYSYRITKPIRDLRRSMKQVEVGDYSNVLKIPPANDEIGALVKSYNKMIFKIKELIEDVYMSGMKRKQAKFLALQFQINPHMLYNTLESIRMKAVVRGQDEIAEMIKVLSRMFRHSLQEREEI